MPRNLRQNVVIFTVVLSFFALSFATSVESAPPQTSKNKKTAKSTPTPAKKTAKATPKPSDKKTQAKAAPTPKKSAAKTSAKTNAKKTDNKSTAKTSAKDKKAAATDKNSKSKQAALTKSEKKAADKKAADKKTAAAKSAKTDAKKSSSRNSKPVTVAKKETPKRIEPSRRTVKQIPAAATTRNTAKTSAKTVSDDAPQIIVTDVSARIRSQAKPGAPELSQAKLGTIFSVAEKTPAWYRVQFASGAKTSSGWISANSVNDLNATGKDQLYRQITERYYKGEGMDFATSAELYDFLTRAASDIGTSDSAGEMELKRLLALRSALKVIPNGKQDQAPYRDFLKNNEKSIVFSEPAGAWYVNSNLFWDLHKKYEKSAFADQIAWEGAQNPLPGVCEGYVNCYLFYTRMTTGEYLSLHPNGKRNLEALTNLTKSLEPIAANLGSNSVYTGPTDVTDRAEFNNLIAELRTIISRLPLVEKEKPLQQLKKIAEGFR